MKQFQEFWASLHDALDKPVQATNWTVADKTRSQKSFLVWSGKGSFAQEVFLKVGIRPNSGAVYCGTLDGKNLRVILKAEAKKIYEIWPEYVARKVPRNKLRHISKNLTYIFGIFHKFEKLMLEGG
jgi:hypothetical protein